MRVRTFALVAGVVFTVVGLLGLFGIGVTHPMDMGHLSVDANSGRLFGLFPVNILHNLFHLAIGVWGLSVYYAMLGQRTYAKSLAIIYAVLAIMGFFPVLNTTFGLIPLYGHDIWLHALTAGAAAYFGWAKEPARAVAV